MAVVAWWLVITPLVFHGDILVQLQVYNEAYQHFRNVMGSQVQGGKIEHLAVKFTGGTTERARALLNIYQVRSLYNCHEFGIWFGEISFRCNLSRVYKVYDLDRILTTPYQPCGTDFCLHLP